MTRTVDNRRGTGYRSPREGVNLSSDHDHERNALTAIGSPRAGSAELAMRRHGVTPEQLEQRARKAVVDWYAARGRVLKPDLLEEAIGYLRIQGLVEIGRFNPDRTNDSALDWLYWKMRRRVPDWLRYGRATAGLGDRRSGGDDRETLTATGELPAGGFTELDIDSLDEAIERLTDGLSTRSAWTLRIAARALSEGRTVDELVAELMRDLADELMPLLPAELRPQLDGENDQQQVVGLLALWAEAA